MTTRDYAAFVERVMRNEADMSYRKRVRTVFDWVAPEDDDRILDAGCGRGFYLRFMRNACAAPLVGIELELPFLRKAQVTLSGQPDVSLVNANLYALPFEHYYFDKAILSEVLEHVEDDVAALRSVADVLKPGGIVAITVPHANYPFWWDPINKSLEAIFHTHIQTGVLAGIWANHVRLYTPDKLRDTVTRAGLEIVEERSFTHSCFPFIHNIVYGLGKTMLESGSLPASMASAADRYDLSGKRGCLLNPVNLGLTLFEWFDRPNTLHEPPGRSTVNLAILARKPHRG